MGLPGCGQDAALEVPAPYEAEPMWLTGLATLPEQRPSLLLITMDTTRRDRLGCYGSRRQLTPRLDELSGDGIVFEQMITPVPITLPAHATILTGLNPSEHGVRHNGLYRLDPEKVTLAERLAQDGYHTGAVIAATPLERQYGLDQGFAHYDDHLGAGANPHTGRALLEWAAVERPAHEVTQRALAWVRETPEGPFFLWAHYFDPHAPYAPPQPYRDRFESAYDGEIAYMDEQIGALVDGVASLRGRENVWIAIMADHGEALGDHGEPTHGVLLHEATLGVPCLLVPPLGGAQTMADSWRGRRVGSVASLRDMAPTLANALGLEPEALPATGRSLLPLLAGVEQAPQVVYTETLAPFLDYGWSALRGLRFDGWSYVKSPVLELYNLARDPQESRNLAAKHGTNLGPLDEWLSRYSSSDHGVGGIYGRGATDAPAPEDLQRLASLGYLSGGRPQGAPLNSKAPQLRMHLLEEIHAAHRDLGADPGGAVARLRGVLEEDPDNPAAWRLQGTGQLRMSMWEQAAESFGSVLNRVPGDSEAQISQAWAWMMSGRAARAEESLASLLERDPGNSRARGLLCGLWVQSDRPHEARDLLAQAAERAMDLEAARAGTATEAAREGGHESAREGGHESARDGGPESARDGGPESAREAAREAARALAQLAQLEWQLNQHERALAVAHQALARDSTEAAAWAIVGEGLWLDARRAVEARDEAAAINAMRRCEDAMRVALAWDRHEPMAAFRMAFLAQQKGHPEEAIGFYERLLMRRPDQALAHVNLGHLLRENGDPARALRHYGDAYRLGHADTRFLVAYGDLLLERGQPEDARQVWTRALSETTDPASLKPLDERLGALGDN